MARPAVMHSVTLNGLPMPPTANRLLIFGRQGRFIRSAEARQFQAAIDCYFKRHNDLIGESKTKLARFLNQKFVFEVNAVFFFPYENLFTSTKHAKSHVKRLDLNNRLKPLFDAIVTLLGIDDALFFRHTVEKRVTDSLEPSVTVQIRPIPTEDFIKT